MLSLDAGCHHVRLLANEVDYLIMIYTPDVQNDISNILPVDASSTEAKPTCIALPPEPFISVLRSMYLTFSEAIL